jgi:hypothetical protein
VPNRGFKHNPHGAGWGLSAVDGLWAGKAAEFPGDFLPVGIATQVMAGTIHQHESGTITIEGGEGLALGMGDDAVGGAVVNGDWGWISLGGEVPDAGLVVEAVGDNE